MIGPEDLSDNDSPINVPKVFLGPQNTPHYLIAFQVSLFPSISFFQN